MRIATGKHMSTAAQQKNPPRTETRKASALSKPSCSQYPRSTTNSLHEYRCIEPCTSSQHGVCGISRRVVSSRLWLVPSHFSPDQTTKPCSCLALASEGMFALLAWHGFSRGPSWLDKARRSGGIELGSHSFPSAPLMKRLATSIQVQLFIPVQSPSRTCSTWT